MLSSCLVVATRNVVNGMYEALLERADVLQYDVLPHASARLIILKSCAEERVRRKIVEKERERGAAVVEGG